jgi:L-asparaginase II
MVAMPSDAQTARPGASHADVPDGGARSTPFVRVTRSGVLEASHVGSLAVVEDDVVTMRRGDPDRRVWFRSTAKPIQALGVVLSGAAQAYGLTDAEVALCCGSHSGMPEHVAGTRSILAKAGIDESALQCGGHWSSDGATAAAQRGQTKEPLRVFSNCSGKHAGMLATAKHLGAPLGTYRDPSHPVQRAILGHVAALCGVAPSDVGIAVDGCGAPTFAVPLVAMARGFARLGAPDRLPAPVAAACRRIADAIRAHPEMVAGRKRFDTDLLRTAAGRVVCKSGAEAVQAVAVPSRRLAFAVKCDDGADRGYRPVVVELLRRLGVLSEAEAKGLADRHAPAVVTNFAGETVGRLEVVVDLGPDGRATS